MSREILIGSFNCQNNKVNRKGLVIEHDIDTTILFRRHVETFSYDVLGTQEVTEPFLKRLLRSLRGYQVSFDYRFGNDWFHRHIPIIKDFNESNPVFIKGEVLEKTTVRLPWKLDTKKEFLTSWKEGILIPRIATIVVSRSAKSGTICTINTHLNHRFPSVRKKQLLEIESIVKRYSLLYPTILLGDFNMNTKLSLFQEFIKSMEHLGLQRVEIDQATQRNCKYAIDHIFIPKKWFVIEKGLMVNKDNLIGKISDHTGIYVKVRR